MVNFGFIWKLHTEASELPGIRHHQRVALILLPIHTKFH